jgi:hypothetical protein
VKGMRWVVLGATAVTLLGAAASASPGARVFLARDEAPAGLTCDSPSPSPSDSPSPTPTNVPAPTPSDVPTDEPCPSPTDSPPPSPSPSPSPSEPPSTLTCPTPPPTTSTGKQHGLENAVSHVYANCKAHPTPGLVNALDHLIANLAKHQDHEPGKPSSHGHGHSQEAVHGKSADSPGHNKH